MLNDRTHENKKYETKKMGKKTIQEKTRHKYENKAHIKQAKQYKAGKRIK